MPWAAAPTECVTHHNFQSSGHWQFVCLHELHSRDQWHAGAEGQDAMQCLLRNGAVFDEAPTAKAGPRLSAEVAVNA